MTFKCDIYFGNKKFFGNALKILSILRKKEKGNVIVEKTKRLDIIIYTTDDIVIVFESGQNVTWLLVHRNIYATIKLIELIKINRS